MSEPWQGDFAAAASRLVRSTEAIWRIFGRGSRYGIFAAAAADARRARAARHAAVIVTFFEEIKV